MDSAHVIVENKGSGTNMSFNLGKDLNYLVLPYSDEENLKGSSSKRVCDYLSPKCKLKPCCYRSEWLLILSPCYFSSNLSLFTCLGVKVSYTLTWSILMATGMRLRCENYLQGSQRKKTIITLSNYTLVRGNKNPEQKGSNICINYCHQNISCWWW